METMEMNRKQWEGRMENLLCEIRSSKEAYTELSEQHKYPQKDSFFKKQVAQRSDFVKIFGDELSTIGDRDLVFDRKEGRYIFDSVANRIITSNLSDIELDRFILQKEQDLIRKYQEVLSYPHIPDATAAILQAEVEDMNNTVLKLMVDLNLEQKGWMV